MSHEPAKGLLRQVFRQMLGGLGENWQQLFQPLSTAADVGCGDRQYAVEPIVGSTDWNTGTDNVQDVLLFSQCMP